MKQLNAAATPDALVASGTVHYLPTFGRPPFARRDRRRKLPDDVREFEPAPSPIGRMTRNVAEIATQRDAFSEAVINAQIDERTKVVADAILREWDAVLARARTDYEWLRWWAARVSQSGGES